MDNDLSWDSLFDGELICLQHRKGYRFSIDSVLLAHFVKPRSGERILDLGTGSGIIATILIYRWRERIREITGIEIQEGLADLARKNLLINGFTDTGRVVQGDIKDIANLIKAESYDKIVCNPPFYSPLSGRTSQEKEAQLARHQLLATLQDFLFAAAFAVKNGGVISFVYPAEQVGEFLVLAKKYRLQTKKIQFIYSYPDVTVAARLVIIQCLKNGGEGTEVLAPFYVYCRKNGQFSPEMQALYRKNDEIPSNADS
jgi:tRNA1(Val) A37 N6-methylase TrmN6